uniref:SRCR domain-containing protein n=1 Tax=Neogobius melanostomus TaxID=47308 RepID=A0A8C6S592_9GOBI
MDCNRTRTGPETCPTLNLTCKEPLRLVGGASRCEGMVEAELRGEWRRVVAYGDWDLEAAAAVCRGLDCGSPVSTERRDGSDKSKVWGVYTDCVKKSSAVRDCLFDHRSSSSLLQVICSDLLNVPEVSVSEGVWAPRAEGELFGPRAQEGDWASPGEGGVWVQMGAHFRVKCSVEPQYPGGSFQLLSPTLNLTLPALNHSAHFLFTDVAAPTKGTTPVFTSRKCSTTASPPAAPSTSTQEANRGHERAQRARRRRARPEEELTDVVMEQM